MTAFQGFPQDDYSFSANDVGNALAGMVGRDSANAPIPGMLNVAPTVTAGAASWRVLVGRFVYVHVVAGAVQLSGLSAPEEVDIVSAAGIPAGQARIDLVCWNPVDAELSVITGTPGTSPIVPPAGALEPVVSLRVNAGDSAVVPARITPAAAVSRAVAPIAFGHAGVTKGFASAGVVELGAAQELIGGITQVGNALRVTDAGLYRLSAVFYFSGGSSVQVSGRIQVDGAPLRTALVWKANGEDLTISADVTKTLAAGALITLHQNSSAWGTTGYNGTHLEVTRVG